MANVFDLKAEEKFKTLSDSYFKACYELGLNPARIDRDLNGFSIKILKKIYYFMYTVTPFNNAGSVDILLNKFMTNRLLQEYGFPVCKSILVSEKGYSSKDFKMYDLQFPVVIKPNFNSCFGFGVVCNINDNMSLQNLLTKQLQIYGDILIEEFQGNLRSYRVLVFFGKIIALYERIPAYVMGDGLHTIDMLIQRENKKREKKSSLSPILPEEETDILLAEQGVSFDTIPPLGKKIAILYKCNAFMGGGVIPLSERVVCSENRKIACDAARMLGLNLVGFDFLCENISIPFSQSRGYIIEANYNPSIAYYERVKWGAEIVLSKKIVRKIFSLHPIRCTLERIFSFFC